MVCVSSFSFITGYNPMIKSSPTSKCRYTPGVILPVAVQQPNLTQRRTRLLVCVLRRFSKHECCMQHSPLTSHGESGKCFEDLPMTHVCLRWHCSCLNQYVPVTHVQNSTLLARTYSYSQRWLRGSGSFAVLRSNTWRVIEQDGHVAPRLAKLWLWYQTRKHLYDNLYKSSQSSKTKLFLLESFKIPSDLVPCLRRDAVRCKCLVILNSTSRRDSV